jgi:PAS domain-containing protein
VAAERGVGTVMVVQVQPGVQGGGAFLVGPVGPLVGPLVEHRAVDALHLAVGLRPVGPGEALLSAELRDGLAEVTGVAVVAGVNRGGAMTLKAIAYVRTYRLDGRPVREPTPIPDEMEEWINSRYRAQRDRLHYYELNPEGVKLNENTLSVRRAVLFHPQLHAIDVLLMIDGPDLPWSLYGERTSVDPNAHPKDIVLDGDGRRVHEFWNDAMAEVAGQSPGEWPYAKGLRRTQFGLVCWDHSKDINAFPVHGVVDVDRLVFDGRFRLRIRSLAPFDDDGRIRFTGYVVLATLCSRTRLLSEELRDDVTDLAQKNQNRAISAAELLRQALALQGRAITIREQTSAQVFLGGDRLPLIFEDVRDSVTMGSVERQDLDFSLNGLQALAAGSFQSYVQGAAQKASTFALAFGFFSLIFGGIAVVELVRSQTHRERAALLAVIASWMAMLAVIAIIWVWNRARSRE